MKVERLSYREEETRRKKNWEAPALAAHGGSSRNRITFRLSKSKGMASEKKTMPRGGGKGSGRLDTGKGKSQIQTGRHNFTGRIFPGGGEGGLTSLWTDC